MSIYLGGSEVTGLYKGSSQVNLYRGSTRIWPPAASADMPYWGQYYGYGMCGKQAGNTYLRAATAGGISNFFYAERSGTITHFRFQRRTGPGYSAGTGGTYTVSVWPADPATRRPITTGTPIAQKTNYEPGTTTTNSQAWMTVAFTTTGQVVAKQPYCITWRNTHADPVGNFNSMNNHNVRSTTADNNIATPPSGTDPRTVGSSAVACSGWSPVWIDGTSERFAEPTLTDDGDYRRHHGEGFMSVRYSDGVWGGICFTAGQSYDTNYVAPINTTNMARQRFRVSVPTFQVDGVWVRMYRLNSSAGSVVVTLESGPSSDTSGNGTSAEQVTVSSSLFTNVVGSVETGADENQYTVVDVRWVWVPFGAAYTLVNGTLYNLRISATGGFTGGLFGNIRVGDNYFGTRASDLTWAAFEAGRTNGTCPIDYGVWWDSRGGQKSSNSGSTWDWFVATGGWLMVYPIVFRVV